MLDDIKRLFKHTSIYSLGNIAMRAGAFILLPLYTHYLSVAQYGILELLYSISSIVTSFLSIGLAHATLRFYFEYDELKDRNAVVTTSLITAFLITCPAVFLLSFFNPFISRIVFDSPDYVLALNLTYIILIFEMGRQIGLSYMRAKEYSILFVGVCITQLVIQVGCNIYTVAFLKLGVNGILIGNLISVFFGLVICSFVIIKECGIRYDLEKIAEIIKYSYPFLFTSISSVILNNADRFILKTLLSMEAVGIYGLALKFGLLLKELIVEPFQRSFGAFRFSIMKQANVRDIQARTLNYLIFVVAWGGLGISLFGKDILRLLAAAEYWSAEKFIPIVVLGLIVGSCNYVFQTGILFQKRTIKLFHISFTTGVISVGLAYLFINFFGLYGACIALVCNSVITILLTNYFSQKLYRVDYAYDKVIICVIIACMAYMVSLLIPDQQIIVHIGLKGLLWIVFPLILYKANFFYEDEIRIVRQLVSRNRLSR